MRHNAPKLDSDKVLAVKGTVIMAATWRNLTSVETKEKGKGKRFLTASPKAHSSTPIDATEPGSSTIEESATTVTPLQ
ncbi:hypothetical protein V6N11_018517 [Hibiscus sabdariffa]|uniref:Uncharacterized protein n=1 Tax=Hibiscus sabdariffa TaxID=183260 RepID=A0ABR2T826_9ROSI